MGIAISRVVFFYPKNMSRDSEIFEKEVIQYFEKKYKVSFVSENISRIIKIKNVRKNFDLVSSDGNHIGDAKYYKMLDSGKSPSAKLSTISEYVWLLEKTNAKHKFIVFGRDMRVPLLWLKRFKSLTNIKFYFFENNKLKPLN